MGPLCGLHLWLNASLTLNNNNRTYPYVATDEESLVANYAMESWLLRVDPHMSLKAGLSHERFVALITEEGVDVEMEKDVSAQFRQSRMFNAAMRTFEEFRFPVNAFVPGKDEGNFKPLSENRFPVQTFK